jgi:hypothetical protein
MRDLVEIHPKYPMLIHCKTCSEYKGIIYSKELEPHLHKRNSDINNPIIVNCLCEGIPCPKCGKIKHRPVSDYYDKEKDTVIHVAYFTGNLPCKTCRKASD